MIGVRRVARVSCFIALALNFAVISPAKAATVTATGTNPSVCNQTVGNATNVVAYRLSGGDCVVEFKNVGSTTWTVPGGVSSIQFLLVGGGASGQIDGGGGGGGGGGLEHSSVSV